MTEPTAADRCLMLDGALTMRTVEATRTTLREAIETTAAGIAIDCSLATEIDLTFVQLLIASRIGGTLSGRSVSLSAAPAGALLDTLTRGGFQVVHETGGFWFAGAAA